MVPRSDAKFERFFVIQSAVLVGLICLGCMWVWRRRTLLGRR